MCKKHSYEKISWIRFLFAFVSHLRLINRFSWSLRFIDLKWWDKVNSYGDLLWFKRSSRFISFKWAYWPLIRLKCRIFLVFYSICDVFRCYSMLRDVFYIFIEFFYFYCDILKIHSSLFFWDIYKSFLLLKTCSHLESSSFILQERKTKYKLRKMLQ